MTAEEESMSEGGPLEKLEEKDTTEEREACIKKAREEAWAKRLQETTEEREARLKKARERAWAKRLQETTEEREACLSPLTTIQFATSRRNQK